MKEQIVTALVMVYLAVAQVIMLREAMRVPAAVRVARYVHLFNSVDDWLWFALAAFVGVVAPGVLWPWYAGMRVYEWYRVRRLLAIIMKSASVPLPPIVPCGNAEHSRGEACPRCKHTAYCDDCGSCEHCRFETPWCDNMDPGGCVRHGPAPSQRRCGECGGSPIHTRACSATALAVHWSTVTRVTSIDGEEIP